MMDRGVLFAVLAINVVAIAVLYGRVSDTQLGQDIASTLKTQLNTILSSINPSAPPAQEQESTPIQPGPPCGLLPWDTDYTIFSNRVVLPDGVKPAAITIAGGKIAKINGDLSIKRERVVDFGDAVISPGVMDVHVHLNEPGREEWEGISTGTAAAAAGGITTVVDMPLNSFPVTTVLARLEEKQQLAKAKAIINVGHWAGLTPENAADHAVLSALFSAGALGFKSFMSPSGIADFPNVGAADIAAALPFLKAAGAPFYVHAEVVSNVPEHEDPTAYATYLASRPVTFERDAVNLLIRLLDEDTSPAAPGFSVHIAHLADAGCLPLIKAAQERGHPISVETCAHYLSFSSQDIPDGATLFKCAPPLRDEDNRQALLSAVVAGQISLVSSDHSPAPPELKQVESGDFLKAWGGISGLQYLLPATWTAISSGGGNLMTLSRVLSSEPAKLAGLQQRKGRIAVGFDADLTVWEPEQAADTSAEANQHRHKLSPYTDRKLLGRVVATIVHGAAVALRGQVQQSPCAGAVVFRDN